MKSHLLAFLVFLIITSVYSQEEIQSIKIPTKNALGFKYFENDKGTGCFFFDMKKEYCFVLVDSAFNAINTYKNSHFTSLQPEFVGSSASGNHFSFFFKLYDDDKLLVYTIDLHSLKIKRTKEFLVTDSKKEKVLSIHFDHINTAIHALTYDASKLYMKEILPDLTIRTKEFAIQESFYKYLDKEDFVYLRNLNDSLLILGLKNKGLAIENESYYVFMIKQNPFDSYYYALKQDKKCKESNAEFLYSYDTFLLINCDKIKFYDLITGNLLQTIAADLNKLIQNEDIPMLKYTMEENPITQVESYKLEKLSGEKRKELLHDYKTHYKVIQKDNKVYLRILSSKSGYDVQYFIEAFLPLNLKYFNISYIPAPIANQTYVIDSVLFERYNLRRTSTHGTFKNAKGNHYLGYIDKKNKSFNIERIEL